MNEILTHCCHFWRKESWSSWRQLAEEFPAVTNPPTWFHGQPSTFSGPALPLLEVGLGAWLSLIRIFTLLSCWLDTWTLASESAGGCSGGRMQEGDFFSHGSNRNWHQTAGMMLLAGFCKLPIMSQSYRILSTFQTNRLTSSPISKTKTNESQIGIETRNIL